MRDGYKNKIIINNTLKALKSLPDIIVDVGVTSPPYNKQEKNKGWLVKNVVYSDYEDRLPEDEYQNNQIEVLNEIYRITKPGGAFFYNHKTRWENGQMFHPMDWLRKTKWVIRQEIIWDRSIAANIRGWRFWQLDERIYWLHKSADNLDKKGIELESRHALLGSIWRFPPERNIQHPAPFPLLLPTRIIYSILNGAKGLVLDPYMGSGTTAVAAKLLGHDYIGIDISKEYVRYAKNRIKNCEHERSVVNQEIELHKVRKTFAERKKDGAFVGRHRKHNTTLFNYNSVLDHQRVKPQRTHAILQ